MKDRNIPFEERKNFKKWLLLGEVNQEGQPPLLGSQEPESSVMETRRTMSARPCRRGKLVFKPVFTLYAKTIAEM